MILDVLTNQVKTSPFKISSLSPYLMASITEILRHNQNIKPEHLDIIFKEGGPLMFELTNKTLN